MVVMLLFITENIYVTEVAEVVEIVSVVYVLKVADVEECIIFNLYNL
jgi:hypothetical protein